MKTTFLNRTAANRIAASLFEPYVRYHYANILHAMRLGIAVVIALVINDLTQLSHGEWTTITVFIILGLLQYQGAIYTKAKERIVGTLLGIVIGLALLWLSHNLLGIAWIYYPLIGGISALIGYYSIKQMGYTGMLTGITMCMIISSTSNIGIDGVYRAANVLIGTLICVLVTLVLPLKSTLMWRFLLANNLEACSAVYDKVESYVASAYPTTKHPDSTTIDNANTASTKAILKSHPIKNSKSDNIVNGDNAKNSKSDNDDNIENIENIEDANSNTPIQTQAPTQAPSTLTYKPIAQLSTLSTVIKRPTSKNTAAEADKYYAQVYNEEVRAVPLDLGATTVTSQGDLADNTQLANLVDAKMVEQFKNINKRLLRVRGHIAATASESGISMQTLNQIQRTHRNIIGTIDLLLSTAPKLTQSGIDADNLVLLKHYHQQLAQAMRHIAAVLRSPSDEQFRPITKIEVSNYPSIHHLEFEWQGYFWLTQTLQSQIQSLSELLKHTKPQWFKASGLRYQRQEQRRISTHGGESDVDV